MKIGALAELTGVTTKTIRYYESLGILPEPMRTESGYRNYEPAAVEQLAFIRDAQASGLTLAEITTIIEIKRSGKSSCAHTTMLLERHLVDIDSQIERLQETRGVLMSLVERAKSLDASSCVDPNRCQTILAAEKQ